MLGQVMIEIQIDCQELGALLGLLGQAEAIINEELALAMERSVIIAEAEIEDRTPVDTGHLRRQLAHSVEGSGSNIRGVVAINNVKYAPWVEYDTRPHDIYPRNARALAWQPGPVAFRIGSQRAQYRIVRGRRVGGVTTRRGAGTLVFSRHVHHPGTTGAHMFRDGATAAAPRVRKQFARGLRRVTARLAGKL